MKIAIEAAEFSPAEANELRKAMATFRSRGTIELLQDKMVGRMVRRGYDEDFARRCFDQIKGFGEYGFPESHAASFALLVYVSSWLKCHYPDVFCAALLNSQPMGFYAPAQLVRDAKEHGVEVRPPDVNYSHWDSTLEPVAGYNTGSSSRGKATLSLLGQINSNPTDAPHSFAPEFALRLGLRQISGFREDAAARLVAARDAPYRDLKDLQDRAGLTAPHVRRLAEADALRSMFLDRRQALWDAKALRDAPDLPLFQNTRDEGTEEPVALPAMPVCEQVVADYQTLRLSLKKHPMAFLRASLKAQRFTDCAELTGKRAWQKVSMAGLVLIRQRPGSAKGVCFITIEDETGVANLVVWPKVMAQFRRVIMQSRLIVIHGYVQRDVDIIHVVAQRLEDRSDALLALSPDAMPTAMAHADEVNKPVPSPSAKHPRDVRIIPKSRDFH